MAATAKPGRTFLPTVVHLAAEFSPYARTGGLGEAVSGLAAFQHRSGQRVVALLPLYRSVRELAPGLSPAGDPFQVQLGPHTELAQLFRITGAGAGPEVYAVAHPHFFDRPGIYGDSNGDYQDNARRFAFFVLAALQSLPRFVSGPAILHAHDWHTALAPLYLRATASCLSAIVVMQVVNVFLCRSERASAFRFGLLGNRLLLAGVAVEVLLILAIDYTEVGNRLFGTAPVEAAAWLFVLPFALGMLALDELRKWRVRRLAGAG